MNLPILTSAFLMVSLTPPTPAAGLQVQPEVYPVHEPVQTPDALHGWIRAHTGLNIPRQPVCVGHCAPFDYVCHAYFEPTRDCVVWAPRGGGKTRLAALATLLDLLHKPGAAVRILGGSLDQSLKIWEHLLPDLERLTDDQQMSRKGSAKKVLMEHGGSAAVLTQSQRAVRGLRVQKLRCDEIELFDPRVWDAAQLTTKSISGNQDRAAKVGGSGGVSGGVTGAVEAFSTLHLRGGLMSSVVDRAIATGTPVYKWCLMEVLAKCEPWRDCLTCDLWEDCGGKAKTHCQGFVPVEDAIALKRRVSTETWESEMMCRKPVVRGRVFPSFDADVHVVKHDGSFENASVSLGIDFGFANPFVCLWIRRSPSGVVTVLDEYVMSERTMDVHLREMAKRRWMGGGAGGGEVRVACCDPAGRGRNDQTATSNVQLLRNSGYIVRERKSKIVDGIEHIRRLLAPAAGEPRLFIHARCRRLIEAMESYRYGNEVAAVGGSGGAGGGGGGSGGYSAGELPLKDGRHDHLIDALRYNLINHVQEKVKRRCY